MGTANRQAMLPWPTSLARAWCPDQLFTGQLHRFLLAAAGGPGDAGGGGAGVQDMHDIQNGDQAELRPRPVLSSLCPQCHRVPLL
jgi:hypothetical protein